MLQFISNNPLSNAIRHVKSVLDPDQKRRSLIMIGLLVINAIFDFAGLATIGALIKSALEDNIFEGTHYIRGANETEIMYFLNSGLRWLYDQSGAPNHISFLFYLSIIIFAAFIIKNAISIYIGYVQSRFAYNISLRLNKKMFKHFYDQGYLFIKDSTSGKKVYSIIDIPMRFASHYLNTLLMFGTDLVVILIIAIALFCFSPISMLLLAVTIVPTFYLIYWFTKNRVREIGNRRNELAPRNYAKVFESMNGYVDIKLSNIENEVLRKYSELQKQLNHVDALYHGVYLKLNQRTNDIIFGLSLLVIFGYANYSKMGTTEVLALLGLFAIAAYKFLPSVNRMLSAMLTMKNSSFVFKELKEVTNIALEEFDHANPLPFEKEVSVHNLSYRYPGTEIDVLKNVSFTVKKGETIGFIGSSGSGKTTLLKVMLRLIDEYEGALRVDGQLIDRRKRSAYQKIIGYVEQEIFILNDTIKNNVAFGLDKPDIDKVWQSLKEAQLDQFVKSHPKGLDMPLGENGVNLSGGQKQRIGIARALYKNSEILMFDEATSALDGETEKAVVESINHLSKLGKTVLIVAHRITTLEKCDRIYELMDGRIVKEHNYNALIKSK